MPASVKQRELVAAVANEVVALEQISIAFDGALETQNWAQCAALMADYRRITHALANAMLASKDTRDAAFETQLRARSKRVMDRRDRHIEQLEEVHRVSGEKLRSISNWKIYARAVGSRNVPKPSAGLNRLT